MAPQRTPEQKEADAKAGMMVILFAASPVGIFQKLTRSRLTSEEEDSTLSLAMMKDLVGDQR